MQTGVRLGVLDVGSNTVHLLVVDAHPGAAPVPAASVKVELRLAELLAPDGTLSEEGAERLVDVVGQARSHAERLGVDDLMAFATSAVREAGNGAAVLGRVRDEAGVDLEVLSGRDEAALTFLAVRRWYGWSSGLLLALDIGGGSLEVACGRDEAPQLAVSLPLGAGRLTRGWLEGDPPPRTQVTRLRKYVRAQLAPLGPALAAIGPPDHVVATSKTFRSLARIAGVAPYSKGPYVRRVLTRDALAEVAARIAPMTAAARSRLDGVSPGRAGQLLAGAVVAAEVLERLEVSSVEICPWALREGVILRRLDWLAGG